MMVEFVAYPPLSCRTSPPQGGRSICGDLLPISAVEGEAMLVRPANLPTCGGDVRQDRGARFRTHARGLL